MNETMTKYERILTAMRFEEADRVPVIPINCYIIPYQAGLSIKEMFHEPDKLIKATEESIDFIGDCIDPNITTLDHLSMFGKSGWDQATLDWRIWDEYPPEGNIPSCYEKPLLNDYDDAMDRGFATLLYNTEIYEKVFDRSIDEFIFYEFEYPEIYAKAWRGFVEKHDIPLLIGGRFCHPLDLLQYYRGISQLTEDIFERPEKVLAMCEWLMDFEMTRAMRQAQVMGAGEVPGAETIFFINGGPPGMSPGIFNEFYWPLAKKAVDTFVNRGFRVHCHWDNDQTPNLETISHLTDGLPVGRVRLDLEKTNMKKAKEILGGKVCFMGNVPSALLVYGSPDEVDAYCKKLIEDCAEGGGYILGVECETPWDAKRENAKAVADAAAKYGAY